MFSENNGIEWWKIFIPGISVFVLVTIIVALLCLYCCKRCTNYEKVTEKKKVTIYSKLPKIHSEWISRLIDDDNFLVEVEHPQDIKFPFFTSKMTGSSGNKYILYHSKTNGRINLIDGTDPLYKNILPKMCSKFGKENIAVVVDHLGNNIEEMKRRIERSQASVYKYAKYMFYFKNGCKLDNCSDASNTNDASNASNTSDASNASNASNASDAEQIEKIKLKQFLSGTDQPDEDLLNPDSSSETEKLITT